METNIFLQISMNFWDSYEQVVDGVDTLPSPGGLGVQQWTKAVVTAAITCKKSPRYFLFVTGKFTDHDDRGCPSQHLSDLPQFW